MYNEELVRLSWGFREVYPSQPPGNPQETPRKPPGNPQARVND